MDFLMADWGWLLAALEARAGQPPATIILGDMPEARGRSVEFNLRGACTAQWTLDGDDRHAAFVKELLSDLYVFRDKRCLFRGRVGSCDDDVDADRHVVTCSAVDYRGLLERRVLMVAHDYGLWHPQHIALDMINIAQLDVAGLTGGGPLGIVDNLGPLGPLISETFDRDTNVMANINRLQDYKAEAGGLEWWIEPGVPNWKDQLVFFTRTWRGEAKNTFPLVLGTTITELKRTFDTQAYANHVIVRGGKPEMPMDPPDLEKGDDPNADIVWVGSTGQQWGTPPNNRYTLRSAATTWAPGRFTPDARWYQPPPGPDGKENKQDRTLWYWDGIRADGTASTRQWVRGDELPEPSAIRQAGDWHRRPMGRLSKAVSNSELVTQETVNSAADELLAECLRPASSYQCTLKEGVWKGPNDAWLGDRLPIIARSGDRMNTVTTARVWTMKLEVDEDGREQVTMTLDQPDPEDWS